MKTTLLSLFLAAFTLPTCVIGQSWIQLGADIDGEAAYDLSGVAVSTSNDGKTIAVGATANQGNGNNAGHVRIFTWNGTNWAKKVADLDGNEDEWFGYSISLNSDGNTIAIGAPIYVGANKKGLVRIYNWNGSAWVQKGATIAGVQDGDRFGESVNLSSDGNVLAIGVPNSSNSVSASGGIVKIYLWNGTSWSQKGTNLEGEANFDGFGTSVCLSYDGNIIAVGAPNRSSVSNNAGQVKIYSWNGTAWIQKGSVINGAEYDKLGHSVNLSADGNTLAIGAPNSSVGADFAGYVKIYKWADTDWSQKGQTLVSDVIGDKSGTSVYLSADGNTVAVGHPHQSKPGLVKVYNWSGTTWTQKGLDIVGEENYDGFGTAVCLSADGKTVVIGGPYNEGSGIVSGHTRVYKYEFGTGLNEQLNELTSTYNNPTSGELKIQLDNHYATIQTKITNNIGQVISSNEFYHTDLIHLEINAPAGIYFVELNTDNLKRTVIKVLKQ